MQLARVRYNSAMWLGLLLVYWLLLGADQPRTVDPTFLHRYVPDIAERQTDITTRTCHYKPVFGAGDPQARALKGIARFGEMTVDPGGESARVSYPDEEQIYVVLEGAAALDSQPIRKHDFLYLRSGLPHAVKNAKNTPCRILVMGFRVPKGTRINGDLSGPPVANMDDVPLQTV